MFSTKKRPFLLIEALVALTLVILCAVPLVEQPLKFYEKELKALQRLELERLAEWTFSEIKELLLKNAIPWEQIPVHNERTGPFYLKKATLQVPGCKKKEVERSFTLYGKGEKTGKSPVEYRQIYITLLMEEETFEFRVPVEK